MLSINATRLFDLPKVQNFFYHKMLFLLNGLTYFFVFFVALYNKFHL
jgi:hypothetical protein